MLTNGEIDSLARQVLSRILDETRVGQSGFFNTQLTEQGECVVVYKANAPNHGGFWCSYRPLNAVKAIVSECEYMLEGFTMQSPDGEVRDLSNVPHEARVNLIRQMADVATLQMLVSLRQRLCETVEDAVQESMIIGRGFLVSAAIQGLKEEVQGLVGDARPEIEEAVERAANKRRQLLREFVRIMPNLMAERGRGGRKAKHRWTENDYANLTQKYEELKVLWVDAKRIAKDAQRARSPQRNKHWREEVQRAYPELPQDLLERFAHLRADDAKPSDIALLHAQRECGITQTYTARELREKIRAWKLKTGQSGSAETPENAEPEN